jgi:hypothetical protein
MRLLISIIDWEYPTSKEEVQPTEWHLQNKETLLSLLLAYGNGIILELRAEGDNEESIGVIRGVAKGTGSGRQVELSLEEKQKVWLFQEGDECYRQPMESSGFTFINPIPQPHKFVDKV